MISNGNSFEKSMNQSKRQQDLQKVRIMEVRKQEAELAKSMISELKSQKYIEKEKQEKQKRLDEYKNKLKAIEELEQLKQTALLAIGEAQRKAIQKNLELDQQEARKLEIMDRTNKLSQARSKDAKKWLQKEWNESQNGQQHQRIDHLKKTVNQEKIREISLANKFQSTYEQSQITIDYKGTSNKNKKSILKPEDFQNTHFHNPSVIKHSLEKDIENAMDFANNIFIESQAQLESTAKQWRQQERSTRERGIKAISKQKDKEVLQEFNKECNYLKRKQTLQIRKSISPCNKKTPSQSSKIMQTKLSNEFNKIFINKEDDHGQWIDNKQNKQSYSLSKSNDRKPPTIKQEIYSKFNETQSKSDESTNRIDYSNYPLTQSEQKDSQEKRRVQFLDVQKPEISVRELSQSKGKFNDMIQKEEVKERLANEIKIDDQSQQEEEEEQIELKKPYQFSSSKKNDMNEYIQEQENYLKKLEYERIRITQQMKQEEQNLLDTFKDQNRLLKNDKIIQEEESQDSSQSELLQESQVQKNFSEREYLSSEQTPQKYQQKQYEEDSLEKEKKDLKYEMSSDSLYSYSPESNIMSSQKMDKQEEINARNIMNRFLKPSH